jgi:hypothetical protein
MDGGAAYFANVWSDAGAVGEATLRAAAQGGPLPDYRSARRWLCENDVLNESGDFVIPIMGRWIKAEKC